MFVLYDEQMNVIPFPDGVTHLDIFISSIGKERYSRKIEGSNESVYYGFTYNSRNIELYMLLKSYDTEDYRLQRDAVYDMFHHTDRIYVSESYQKGKRYLISVDEVYIPERAPRNQKVSDVTIRCTKLGIPFAESIKTTSDIDKNGLNYGDGWHYGMGLLYDEDSHRYTHTGTSFKIYNAGNKPIHPFEQDLKIEISDVIGSGGYLELKNITNGSAFRVNESVSSSQKIILDGPNITNNGLQYLRKTNKQFIELSPGWNEFIITGATSAKVKMDFRFYYA